MEREEILERIEQIKRELENDQYALLRDKIMERPFHLHGSNRNPLTRKLIQRFRKRLLLEVELILEPVLDTQREINLRFLEEIERLKRKCLSPETASGDNERKASGPLSQGRE